MRTGNVRGKERTFIGGVTEADGAGWVFDTSAERRQIAERERSPPLLSLAPSPPLPSDSCPWDCHTSFLTNFPRRNETSPRPLFADGDVKQNYSSEVGFVLRTRDTALSSSPSQPGRARGPIDRLGAKTLDEIAIRLEMAVIW